jgi:hypothetical protein
MEEWLYWEVLDHSMEIEAGHRKSFFAAEHIYKLAFCRNSHKMIQFEAAGKCELKHIFLRRFCAGNGLRDLVRDTFLFV